METEFEFVFQTFLEYILQSLLCKIRTRLQEVCDINLNPNSDKIDTRVVEVAQFQSKINNVCK